MVLKSILLKVQAETHEPLNLLNNQENPLDGQNEETLASNRHQQATELFNTVFDFELLRLDVN